MTTTLPIDTYPEKKRVTLIGAAVNLPLALVKILVGLFGNSQALLADGIHSLTDLLGDAAILLAVRAGSQEADDDHPYGHARIETAASVGVGLLLMAIGAGMAYDAAARIAGASPLPPPSVLALVIAAISVVAKEALYRYTIAAATRLDSSLMRANAWHHRSDGLSSLIALAGIGGAIAGITFLDALAAIVIAVMLAKIGWETCWPNMKELVDTGLSPERINAMRTTVDHIPEVRRIGMLRTRRMGNEAYADIEVMVDPMLSVSEAHRIGESVRQRLVRDVKEVADVCVHVEPDETTPQKRLEAMPPRSDVLPALARVCQDLPGWDTAPRIVLHYIDNRIDVEVFLPPEMRPDDPESVATQYRQAVADLKTIRTVNVLWS